MPNYFIENFMHLRSTKKITQKILHKETKILFKTIAQWTSKMQVQPQTKHLKLLSDYFRVSIDDLVFSDCSLYSDEELKKRYNTIQKRLVA